MAVKLICSELKDLSVVIETESSPTNLPLIYNENQLSAQTSALNDNIFAFSLVEVGVIVLVVSSGRTDVLASEFWLVCEEHPAVTRIIHVSEVIVRRFMDMTIRFFDGNRGLRG